MTSWIYPPELRLRGQEPYGRMGCCGVTDKVSRRLKELKFTFTFSPLCLKDPEAKHWAARSLETLSQDLECPITSDYEAV